MRWLGEAKWSGTVLPTGVTLGLVSAVHSCGLAACGVMGGHPRGLVLVATLVAWQFAETLAAAQRRDTGDWGALWIGLVALGSLVASLTAPGTGTGWGLGLVVVGIVVRLSAIRTLGPAFLDGVEPLPGIRRIASGPYRYLAHPADLGLASIGFGAALTTGSIAGAGLAGLLATSLVARTRAEERAWTRTGV